MTANFIEFTSAFDAFGVGFGGADILISGGPVHMVGCTGIGDIQIDNGGVHLTDVNCQKVTLASGNGESLRASRLTCLGLDLSGGAQSQYVVIDGLSMPSGQLVATGNFNQFSITGAAFGQTDTNSGAFSIVDLNGLDSYRLEATIYRSAQHGILLTDCVAGDHYLTIIDPSAGTDNTYDGVNLAGACDQLNFYGSVRGAVNQANNPQYGFNAGAGTVSADVWMAFSGYQTAATNDASGNVVFHT